MLAPQEQSQFAYSSLKPIRDNIQNSLAPPTITTVPIDSDKDGLVDSYNITLRIKKPLANLALRELNVLLAFDFEISDIVKMRMEGILAVNINAMSSPTLSASKLSTTGHLKLRQPNALSQSPKVRDVYSDNYFDSLQVQSMESFLFNYQQKRNETLFYSYNKQIQYGSQNYIDLEMTIDVPKQDVLYTPKFW